LLFPRLPLEHHFDEHGDAHPPMVGEVLANELNPTQMARNGER
jgi:hypothetical protein